MICESHVMQFVPSSSLPNPYDRKKLIAEQILRDLEVPDPSWRIVTRRYFNRWARMSAV